MSKKRLIDASALKQMFDEREADDVELYGVHIAECFPADDAKEIVDKMPTVDAVEVVHGRWVVSGFGFDVCSVCRKVYKDGYFTIGGVKPRPQFNYCPNCGAKMDGGESGV